MKLRTKSTTSMTRALLAATALLAVPGHAASGDWPSFNNTLKGTRYGEQTELTAANVARLQPLCTFDVGRQVSFQTGPIVVDGTMYVTTDFDTIALDAATCALRWRSTEQYKAVSPLNVNRGAAIADGRVFRGTQDGRVIGYDAASGKWLWTTTIASAALGETVPTALLAWQDLVFAGNAGGDNKGVKGRMYALDARTGRIVWEQYMVPREPSDVARGPAAPVPSIGWTNKPGIPISGGASWTSYTLDPETGTLYFPGGNPAPDFAPQLRPGSNPYAGSIVALDARSGSVRQVYPIVERDFHDWDVSAPPAVLTTRNGRAILASAIKDGYLRGIDARSGAILYRTPITTIYNATTALPVGKPIRFCPGTQGGSEWNGPSYSPVTNLVYTGTVDWCTIVTRSPDAKIMSGKVGQPWSGMDDEKAVFGKFDAPGRWAGWIYATDADTGRVAWRFKAPAPILGAVTATAGGLVFTGDMAGNAYAFDATTGAKLWQADTAGAIGGGVISYAVGNSQRIAIAAGMTSPIWPTQKVNGHIIVYGLPEGRR